jgi:hypothetical protein
MGRSPRNLDEASPRGDEWAPQKDGAPYERDEGFPKKDGGSSI